MKTKTKMFSVVMSFVMALSFSSSAFAAEKPVDPEIADESVIEIPIVFEEAEGVVPLTQGDEKSFMLGTEATISNAGFYPEFQMWVTGGSSEIQVKFDVVSPGGVHMGPYGPVPADGTLGCYLKKTALIANGTWRFTAYISNGVGNPGNLVCHVKQSY